MTFFQMLIIIILLAAADILVGFIYCQITKSYKSSVMAIGLYKKAANIIIFCVLSGVGKIDILAEELANVNIVVGVAAFIYIAIMEIMSIYENWNKIREFKEEK